MGPTIEATLAVLSHWNTSGIASVITLVAAFAVIGCITARQRQEQLEAEEQQLAASAERLNNGVTVWRTHRPIEAEPSC